MRYVSKKCPYCGTYYQLLKIDGEKFYGSPFIKCKRCGKTFCDTGAIELAIQKPRWIDTVKISPFNIMVTVTGLFLFIFSFDINTNAHYCIEEILDHARYTDKLKTNFRLADLLWGIFDATVLIIIVVVIIRSAIKRRNQNKTPDSMIKDLAGTSNTNNCKNNASRNENYPKELEAQKNNDDYIYNQSQSSSVKKLGVNADLRSKLQEYKSLYEEGLISQEDYDKLKKKALDI